MERALVVAGGELPSLEQLRSLAGCSDLVVAADGGANHLYIAGVAPHAVVGDLDSVEPEALKWCRVHGAQVLEYPPEKDYTDLQLAVETCVSRGAQSILIAGALGGRIDHSLGNLALLESLQAAGVACAIVHGGTEVRLVGTGVVFSGAPGDTLSLVPLDRTVSGITTFGLRYRLVCGVLTRGGVPSGVSNEFLDNEARVEVEQGALLAVHTRIANM